MAGPISHRTMSWVAYQLLCRGMGPLRALAAVWQLSGSCSGNCAAAVWQLCGGSWLALAAYHPPTPPPRTCAIPSTALFCRTPDGRQPNALSCMRPGMPPTPPPPIWALLLGMYRKLVCPYVVGTQHSVHTFRSRVKLRIFFYSVHSAVRSPPG